MAERLKSIIPKPTAALRIEALKRAVVVAPFPPHIPNLWSAEVEGQPSWGSACGFSEADAKRHMEIVIEDAKGDMEVMLSV